MGGFRPFGESGLRLRIHFVDIGDADLRSESARKRLN